MAEWRFLLDENVDPKTASYLDKAGIRAKHVRDTLEVGATDEEILRVASQRNLVVVTSDVRDFGDLPQSAHAGLVLLYDDTMPAFKVASGIIAMVDAYPGRDAFSGREELDPWV